jgi:BMFP domain-containing protein YqiC
MDAPNIFEEIQTRVSKMLEQTPAKDIERNVRAVLQQGFSKLELATREELDLQTELLSRARARLSELETRVEELEKRIKGEN